MDTYKAIHDCDGNVILLGMFLIDINYEYLTYQVRLKNNQIALHTDCSYSQLSYSRAKALKILPISSPDILRYGHNLFNSSLV